MAKVGFIGLGNMGGPMVRNLIKAGHSLKVYDLSEDAINFAVQAGAVATKSVKEASSEVDFVVTMVPVGSNVREIFLEDGILAAAAPGTVMIDSSTIDVGSAQAVHEAAKSAGFNMIDAPVSGGVIGADAGTSPSCAVETKTALKRPSRYYKVWGKILYIAVPEV